LRWCETEPDLKHRASTHSPPPRANTLDPFASFVRFGALDRIPIDDARAHEYTIVRARWQYPFSRRPFSVACTAYPHLRNFQSRPHDVKPHAHRAAFERRPIAVMHF